jgi:hypothetical protein
MMTRKNLGKGKGMGYKNLIRGYDAKIHSNSAKGMKMPQKVGMLVGHAKEGDYYNSEKGNFLYTGTKKEDWENPKCWKSLGGKLLGIERLNAMGWVNELNKIGKEIDDYVDDIQKDKEGGQQLKSMKEALKRKEEEFDALLKNLRRYTNKKGGKSPKYDVQLGDDGTLDTLVYVNGKPIRFDMEFASMFRNKKTGAITERGWRQLKKEAIDAYENDMAYDELGGKLGKGGVTFKFISANGVDSETILSPFQSSKPQYKQIRKWADKVALNLEKKYGQTWYLSEQKDYVVQSSKGGKTFPTLSPSPETEIKSYFRRNNPQMDEKGVEAMTERLMQPKNAPQRYDLMRRLRKGGKSDKNKTPIIFRKFKDGDIIAVFPDDIADLSGNVTMYQHQGQHGAGDYNQVMQQTKKATPKEYAKLNKELKSIGYKIKPVSKDTPKMQQKRTETLSKYFKESGGKKYNFEKTTTADSKRMDKLKKKLKNYKFKKEDLVSFD